MWRIDVCIIRITTVSLFFKHNYTEPEVFKELQFVGPQHWQLNLWGLTHFWSLPQVATM